MNSQIEVIKSWKSLSSVFYYMCNMISFSWASFLSSFICINVALLTNDCGCVLGCSSPNFSLVLCYKSSYVFKLDINNAINTYLPPISPPPPPPRLTPLPQTFRLMRLQSWSGLGISAHPSLVKGLSALQLVQLYVVVRCCSHIITAAYIPCMNRYSV